MGKLWVDRIIDIAGGEISDDADGSAVVVAHNDVERAMSEIFGIPLGLNITKGIFENPDNFAGVTSAGKISMMRLKTSQVQSDGGQSCGLEFDDGTEKRRLTFVGSQLQVWGEVSTGVWELLHNHESEEEGTLSDKTDAGPMVAAKSPEEYVIAVDTVGEGEEQRFTLVPDVVYETGRTEFIELADVSAAFKGLPYQEAEGPYDENKIGWGVAIGGEETVLIPVKLMDLASGAYSFHLYHRGAVVLDNVGREGNGTWTPIGPLEINIWNLPENGLPHVVSYGGTARAAVEIPDGVYKIKPTFRVTSTGVGHGKMMIRLVGSGFHIFPQEGLLSQEVPWKYVVQDPPREDWWHNWYPEVTDVSPHVASAEVGETIIVVPSAATIGFEMGITNGEASVWGELGIERIQ